MATTHFDHDGGPTRLDVELTRQQIEDEVRSSYETQYQAEVRDEKVMASLALRIWKMVGAVVIVLVGLPLLGLALGMFLRVLRWSSGLW